MFEDKGKIQAANCHLDGMRGFRSTRTTSNSRPIATVWSRLFAKFTSSKRHNLNFCCQRSSAMNVVDEVNTSVIQIICVPPTDHGGMVSVQDSSGVRYIE